MANLSMSGDPLKKKKKDSGVADCTDGKCGPTTRGRMSLSKFNPTKSRYSIGKVDKPDKDREDKIKKPIGGYGQSLTVSGMNSNPGDVRIQKDNAFASFSEEQMAAGRKGEVKTRKEKAKIKASKEE